MSLCTEEEAKERWCPFVSYERNASNRWHRQAHRNPETGEQFTASEVDNPEQCRCIASQCMAWRWAEQGHDAGDFSNTPEHPSTGYCGLASDPDPLVTTLPISALNMPAGKP